MTISFSLFQSSLLFLLPVVFIWIPLPVGEHAQRGAFLLLLLAYYLSIGWYLSLPKFFRVLFSDRILQRFALIASFALPLTPLLLLRAQYFHWFPAVVLWGCIILVFSLVSYLGSRLRGSGILSLFVFIGALLGVEYLLQTVPADVLRKEVARTPALVRPERTFQVYRNEGFRGKKPCSECPDNLIRIVTLGGSSVYGVPMQTGTYTYSSYLQEMLEQRFPDTHFEVLNAGIAGHGITQIRDALENVILDLKPDIVTISSWFNDTSLTPGWYGVPGKSDSQAYEEVRFLRKLSELSWYQMMHQTRLFALLRFLLLECKSNWLRSESGKKIVPGPRSNPKEFRQTLTQTVELALTHDVLPVIVLESRNRPRELQSESKGNPYYKANLKVADDFDLPLVDTLSALDEKRGAWLFYDFIHPNREGHRIVAETIFHSLFEDPGSERMKEFLQKHDLPASKDALRNVVHLQIDSDQAHDFSLQARGQRIATDDRDRKPSVVQLIASVNGSPFQPVGNLEERWKAFNIPVEIGAPTPLLDVELRARALTAKHPAYRIGTSELYSPVHLELVSGGRDYGWRGEIRVARESASSNGRGYNVALIDQEWGIILAERFFDFYGTQDGSSLTSRMVNFLSGRGVDGRILAVDPLVAIVVKTDGFHNIDGARLAKAFRKLGGSGKIPGPFESFLLVGKQGLAEGTALEMVGPKLLTATIGKERPHYQELFAVSTAQVANP